MLYGNNKRNVSDRIFFSPTESQGCTSEQLEFNLNAEFKLNLLI